MVLHVYSDASYIIMLEARGCYAGHFYLSNCPRTLLEISGLVVLILHSTVGRMFLLWNFNNIKFYWCFPCFGVYLSVKCMTIFDLIVKGTINFKYH